MAEDSPAQIALKLAADASFAAGAARAALGGYVPVDHPSHPSKWSADRREALARAEDEIARTAIALAAAKAAVATTTPD